MHRPVVKSKLNDALSSGKKVPAASSPSKPSSSTAKPTTWKSLVKLVPVAIPSKTPMKNKAPAKELEPEFSPYCLSRLVTSQVACELCAGFAYQSRTRRVGGRGRGSDAYQVEVRSHIPEEDVHAITRRRAGGGGRQGAVEPKSRAGASYKPKSGPSLIICCVWCEVYCCSSAFSLGGRGKKVPWLVYAWCRFCPWCGCWFAWCWTCS